MKRLILLAALCFGAGSAFSQTSIFTFYGGGGTSLKYNYDLGLSGGLRFGKEGKNRTAFGAQVFYQGYAFKYNKEAYGETNGSSLAGMTIINKSSYVFVAPGISQFLGNKNKFEAFLNVGVGFKMSGEETMRKWDNTHGYLSGDYDSTLITTPNINTMLIRVGFGMTEYLEMGKNWRFTFTEDFGFVTSSLTKTSDANYPSRTAYSPHHKLNPFVISLQIGISRMKAKSDMD